MEQDSSDSNSIDLTDSRQDLSDSHDSLQSYKKLDYKSLSDDEKCEGYVFHILSDKVSEDSRTKLDNLAKNLSQIYPCEIEVHICDDSKFQGLPKLNGNYLAYFRFFIPDFIPKNANICLYLDTDMLVLRDLRGLFALDLENKLFGVVKEWMEILHYIHKSHGTKFCIKGGVFEKFYFNSGLLLINLMQWRKENITKQCFDFFIKYKDKVVLHDQDALNYVAPQDKVMVLPFEFNVFIDRIKENNDFLPDYSDNEIEYALQNIIIYHYKPWNGFGVECVNSWVERMQWWQVAWNVPYFSDELRRIFTTKRDNYLVCKDFGLYIANLINKCSQSLAGYLKMPFVVWSAFRNFDLNHNYAVDLRESIDKNVAFELMSVAARAWGKKSKFERIFKFIVLPLRIYRIKKHCAKGIFKAQKGNKIFTLYAE